MKNRHLSLLTLLLFALTQFTSCEEFFAELIEDPLAPGVTEVLTLQPKINAERVLFEGEVKQIPHETKVEYGFMWFKANEETPQINRLVVGTMTSDGRFEAPVSGLPRNERLVVCAFVKTVDAYETETIGEERDFSWGF